MPNKQFEDYVIVTMTAAFTSAAFSLPKLTDKGERLTVKLNREQAKQVINGQRGQVAAKGVLPNYVLEASDDNSGLHQTVSAADKKSHSKPN